MKPSKRKVLITGANGFIGSNLTRYLKQNRVDVVQSIRGESSALDVVQKNLSETTDWSDVLPYVDTVIHTSGITHSYKVDDQEIYDVNYLGTKNLIDQCIKFHVNNFIFFSTIKVCGENTEVGEYFNKFSSYEGRDSYSESKKFIELYLKDNTVNDRFNYLIVRSPLVFGKEVRGNLGFFETLLKKKIPIPLGNVTNNSRAIVKVNTLNSLLLYKLKNPTWMKNQIICPVDGHFSTLELVKLVAEEHNMFPKVFSVPNFFLKFCMTVLGKSRLIPKIFGDLQVRDVDNLKSVENLSSPGIEHCLDENGLVK